MVFSLFFAISQKTLSEVNDLRHPLEKPMACALQIAKQADYSRKVGAQKASFT